MKVEIIIRKMQSDCMPKLIYAVDFMGKTYGCGTPCENDNDISEALSRSKAAITREGDSFFVSDCRIVQMDMFG